MVEDLESVPLLVAADLPAGWQMPDPSPIDPEHDSAQLDAALRYEQWVDPAPGLDRRLNSGHNNNDAGRWFLIQHVESSTRVLLRLQRQYLLEEEPKGEVRITGIVYLPEWAGDPVASPMLRNLPTSRIEAAASWMLCVAAKRCSPVISARGSSARRASAGSAWIGRRYSRASSGRMLVPPGTCTSGRSSSCFSRRSIAPL